MCNVIVKFIENKFSFIVPSLGGCEHMLICRGLSDAAMTAIVDIKSRLLVVHTLPDGDTIF